MADARLEREARVFTRYLVGAVPSPDALGWYLRGAPALAPAGRDGWLLALARAHPLLTRVADAYARLAFPGGALRRRLVILAAILESSSATSAAFEPAPGALPVVAARLAGIHAAWALALAAGILVCGPLHLFAVLTGRR